MQYKCDRWQFSVETAAPFMTTPVCETYVRVGHQTAPYDLGQLDLWVYSCRIEALSFLTCGLYSAAL